MVVTAAAFASPSISIVGLPAHAAVGDTVIISATGGTAPYSWSSNDPGVSVDPIDATNARVIVLQPSASVTITATDVSFNTDQQVITTFQYSARLGTMNFITGDTVLVPVLYKNQFVPLSLLSVDMAIPFDTTLFKFLGTVSAGTLSAGMTVVSNRVKDTIKVGIAATTGVGTVTEQPLLFLRFVSQFTVTSSQSGPLHFTQFLANEVVPGSLNGGLLTVDPVPNYAPVFDLVANDTTMHEGDVMSALFHATDANGDAVHFFLTTNPLPAEASIDSLTGQFLFQPGFSSAGTHLFEVTADDGHGSSVNHWLSVTVLNVNRNPSFTTVFPDTFYATENVPFTFTVQGTDPDLSPVTYTLSNAPVGMTIDSVTGEISWTPSFSDAGMYFPQIIVQDPDGGSDSRTIPIVVANNNRAPVLLTIPNDTTISESQAYTAQFTAFDPDGNPVRYFIYSGAPVGFLLDSVTGAIAYTPSLNDSGTYSIVLKAEDTFGAYVSHTLNLHVKNFNQAPVFLVVHPDTVYALEGQYSATLFQATDADGDSVHYYNAGGFAPGMTIDPVSGLLEWVPSFSQAGTYDVRVQAVDVNGGTALDSVTLIVLNFDRPPVLSAMPDTVYAKEGQLLSYNIPATDPDGDSLRYHVINAPTGMNVDSLTGLVTWTPDFFQAGTYIVVNQAVDSFGLMDVHVTTIMVIDSNRAPMLTVIPHDTVINEGQSYIAQIQASDPDSDPVRYFLQGTPPSGLSLDSLTGVIQWTPSHTQQGADTVHIVVTDHRAFGTTTWSYSIQVNDVNLLPYFTAVPSDTVYLPEGVNFNFTLAAIDPDGTPVTFHATSLPAGMTVDSLTGVVDWTPTYAQAGTYYPAFNATDSLGGTVWKMVTFFVLNTNRPPQFTAILRDTTIAEDQVLQFQYTAFDPDADSLYYSLARGAVGMSITPGGLFQWQPSFTQAGVETVLVRVSDFSVLVVDTVIITVLNVNNPPFFVHVPSDTLIARFDTLHSLYVGADPDGQPVFFTLIAGPAGATVMPDGQFTWVPPIDANGPYQFIVRLSDSTATVDDTLFVTVNRLGDVSGNGTISSFDAGLVLRDQVAAITLSPFQKRIGNVSGDTTLSPQDASYILQYVVGLISGFPGLGKQDQAEAALSAFAFRVVPSAKSGEYDLIIALTQPSHVYGMTVSLGFDSTIITAKQYRTSGAADSMMVSSFFPSQRANIALAGTSPLNSAGEVARLTFALRPGVVRNDDKLFSVEKFILNEKDVTKDVPAITLGIGNETALPTVFALGQNYPNPFNPTTAIRYQLPKDARVTISVYSMIGREVARLVDGDMPAGFHTTEWDGRDASHRTVASGVYLYRITAQAAGSTPFISTKKMLLLK